MENKDLIAKNFSTQSLLNGGDLLPEQNAKLTVLVANQSTLLKEVNFVKMRQSKQRVDKLHISEPVTEAATEDTPTPSNVVGKFNFVELIAEKVKSSWHITHEFLRDNIEQAGAEDTLMATITARMASDFEMLFIQGDTSLPATTVENRLKRRFNGIDILTNDSHIIDAKASSITLDIFAKAERAMPSKYKNAPGLKWIMSDITVNDWMNTVAGRMTVLGDRTFEGKYVPMANGKEIMSVPLIPSDKPINIDTGIPAEVIGNLNGPFVIETGVNDTLIFSINATANITVIIPAGTIETVRLANIINGAIATAGRPAYAYDDGQGRLALRTETVGATANITLVASSALAILGLVAGSYDGEASGTAGILREGSFMLYCNPKNLVFGMVQNARIFSEYNKDNDRLETIIYSEIAATIENPEAIVKVVNLRRKPL
ncbi:MAG: hypothetical protein KKD01_19580 [Proteobacteria bacterium]|nr:hypothetical protein [Pseudomonadota bacterium]